MPDTPCCFAVPPEVSTKDGKALLRPLPTKHSEAPQVRHVGFDLEGRLTC